MTSPFPGFDPARIAAYFKMGEEFTDIAKSFANVDFSSIDPQKIMEVQKHNMETLAAANQTAAKAYEDLFRKQVEVITAATTRARESLEKLQADAGQAKDADAHAKLVQETLESVIQQLTQLTEESAKANAEAFESVWKQVADAASELSTAEPAKGKKK